MKKVVLSLALVALMSISFVSCKETAKEAPAAEETSVEEAAPVEAETPAEGAVSETTETEAE